MSCGAQITIGGLNHLGIFRCPREKDHSGPHAINLGSSLLKKLKGGEAARASAR